MGLIERINESLKGTGLKVVLGLFTEESEIEYTNEGLIIPGDSIEPVFVLMEDDKVLFKCRPLSGILSAIRNEFGSRFMERHNLYQYRIYDPPLGIDLDSPELDEPSLEL